MDDSTILFLAFAGFPLLLISQFFYFRITKQSRMNALKKHGFVVKDDVDRRTRANLSKIAPRLMSRPYQAIGTVSTDGGVLVWWAAEYKKIL